MKRILLILVALVFAVSCSKGGSSKGDYALKINGTPYSKEEVKAEMDSLPEMAKQYFQGPEGMAKFIDELSKKEMLYLEAKKRGLDQSKAFQRKVEEFKKITLINSLLEKEMSSVAKPTDKDVRDFYDKHKDDFMIYNQVKVSQIVVKTEDDLNKVRDKLQAGEDFAKVASEMSIDKATAKSGGNLGTFRKGQLAPQLEEAVFRLRKGDVSMPVTMKDGIHILKMTDAKGTIVDFDKVKGLIAQRVAAEKQRDAFDKFIDSLKKNYKIEVNKDALAQLSAGPAAGPEQQATPAGNEAPAAAPAPAPAPAKK